MSLGELFHLLHIISILWMTGGLMAVLLPLVRVWNSEDLARLVHGFEEADTAKVALLIPGAIFTGITGFVWAVQLKYNMLTTGWLLALILTYLFAVVICLPLVDFGLRRAQFFLLQAQKKGAGPTPELREALGDSVPLVFGFIILLTIPIMAWLPIFKPF